MHSLYIFKNFKLYFIDIEDLQTLIFKRKDIVVNEIWYMLYTFNAKGIFLRQRINL
jgi:hypothetical protein